MALPYPEGEVYFKISLPKYPGFAIDKDDKDFYSNVLVESVWNTWYDFNLEIPLIRPHIRAELVTGYGEWYRTHFGAWDRHSAPFSDKNDGTDITRKNQNFNSVRHKEQDRPNKVHHQPVTIGSEKHIYVDLTVPVRAVYFPIAPSSSVFNKELCTYFMDDCRLRKGVKMRSRQSVTTYDVLYSYSRGLGNRGYESLCFDIPVSTKSRYSRTLTGWLNAFPLTGHLCLPGASVEDA
ncbi:MAG: hypothetical protein LQ337_002693 [Flavoplaca oasis]|nr:MAG: hypothetical protein LQ337_002693 [Flavoplaca oasis]